MASIDIADLKTRVSVADVAKMLNLTTTTEENGTNLRSDCPRCQTGNPRILSMTIGKGFQCFASGAKGTIIDLVMHTNGLSIHGAARFIHARLNGEQEAPKKPPRTPQEPRTEVRAPDMTSATDARHNAPESLIKVLDYLTTDHEIIEALQLPQAACKTIGIGYAPKGTMAGRLLIPLRLSSGKLVGFMGIATAVDQTPLLKFPTNLAEMCQVEEPKVAEPKQSADDLRKMFRVV